MQWALIRVFQTWGVPRWIRVDNGRPLGDLQREMPPVLALWLLGLGIGVIYNRPRTPQANAKVERSQGVLSQWTEWPKCRDTLHLQCRLWEEADFHNQHYPVRRLKGQTRLQAFPTLLHTGRPFDPQHFELQKILDFLAQGNWKRVVSQNGQVNIAAMRFSVGWSYKHQTVSIKLKADINHWQVFDSKGNLIKSIPSNMTQARIWALDLS